MPAPVRVYVDMVGDLFHAGHVELLRAAAALGDEVVVGVLSDASAREYKREPVMSLAERVAVVEACRYVAEVVPDAPLVLTREFLAAQRIDLVVHGDDLDPAAAAQVYGPAVDAQILRLVPRTSGLSTTGVIARVAGRPPLSTHSAVAVPRLILLNGPPGIGKSTLARRYVAEHPGTLNCDIDVLRSWIGGWEDDFAAAGELVRPAALGLIGAHLAAGNDVVLPQLLVRATELERFEACATAAGAEFIERVLMCPEDEAVARFHRRGSGTEDPWHAQVQQIVADQGGDDVLRDYHRRLESLLGDRPAAVRIEAGDAEQTYAALLASLAPR